VKARAIVACLAVLVAAACGDDDGAPMLPSDADDVIHRSWDADAHIGYAVLSRQKRDPLTLGEAVCTVDGQLAVAAAEGAFASSDAEGLCVVTGDTGWIGREAELTPACAGTLVFEFADTTQRNVVCGDAFTAPVAVDCGQAAEAVSLRVVSLPAELDGDVLGTLDMIVGEPGAPSITAPAPQGDGTALWPAGPLSVQWTGSAADAVEITLGQTSGGGPLVRCFAADTGSFTFPDRLLEVYRGGTAFVEVAAIRQRSDMPDGVDFRVSFRESDAIWLFPGAGG
jgi:hypothetical protein